MKAHEEFKKKYISNPQGDKVIKYDNDEKVKILVVNLLFIFRIEASFMSREEIKTLGQQSSSI